ncbi:hypothetical protein CHS0354_004326 [Potamilus streckersoni]|uniref:Iron-sulfur cluster assembly 2 homolog, mitochondrial n=1 Tax=Potamilus streckersoni TaxID=2493646 RepID=A0AAE0SH04_9BIVA|nr:hypothetical protein CHS0354_004326 [Potamilus streckersoni]
MIRTSVVEPAYRAATWSAKRYFHRLSSKHLPEKSKPSVTEVPQSDTGTLHLSDSCVKRLQKISTDQEGKPTYLRVFVEGGGCSGFQYKFELENSIKGDDRVFEKGGVKVVVDQDSMEFIKGATLDYHEELIRSTFRIIGNPKAEQGCSCGSSFSVKL